MSKSFDFDELAQFTGSEQWYRHPLARGIVFTEGAKYLADKAGAYWLLDEIAHAQHYDVAVKLEEFQVWKLSVAGTKALLSCEDGNDREVFTKLIEFTDFPEPGIKLYVCAGTIMPPSEY